jgi:hypothetical protein
MSIEKKGHPDTFTVLRRNDDGTVVVAPDEHASTPPAGTILYGQSLASVADDLLVAARGAVQELGALADRVMNEDEACQPYISKESIWDTIAILTTAIEKIE